MLCATAYAGMMIFDIGRAEEVLRCWAPWAVAAPDEVTTAFRILHLPPLPELPPFLSGRSVVVIDGAVLAPDDAADRILAELRALRPEMDTFLRVPPRRSPGCTWTPRAVRLRSAGRPCSPVCRTPGSRPS